MAIVLPLAEETLGGRRSFFLNWGVRPVGEGLGKAQPQQDPLATDPVPAGAGSEDGRRAGPSPIGKRDNAAISKQSPADRQTGKTAETKQSPAERQTGKRSGNQTKPTLAGNRDRADPQ